MSKGSSLVWHSAGRHHWFRKPTSQVLNSLLRNWEALTRTWISRIYQTNLPKTTRLRRLFLSISRASSVTLTQSLQFASIQRTITRSSLLEKETASSSGSSTVTLKMITRCPVLLAKTKSLSQPLRSITRKELKVLLRGSGWPIRLRKLSEIRWVRTHSSFQHSVHLSNVRLKWTITILSIMEHQLS